MRRVKGHFGQNCYMFGADGIGQASPVVFDSQRSYLHKSEQRGPLPIRRWPGICVTTAGGRR